MKEQIHLHGANDSDNQIISFLTGVFLSITWFQSLQFVCTVICQNKDLFKWLKSKQWSNLGTLTINNKVKIVSLGPNIGMHVSIKESRIGRQMGT